MNCGFAVECYAVAAGNGLLDWLASLLDLRTLVGLWLGALIGAQFGWPGFIALTLGLASFLQRKRSSDTIEVPDEDPVPVRRKSPVRNPVTSKAKRYNPETGNWE